MQPGAMLTLGADLQLLPQPPSFTLPAYLGVNGTLNANGHAINVITLSIGFDGPTNVVNRGAIQSGDCNSLKKYS